MNYSTDNYVLPSYQEICGCADGFELPINVYLPQAVNARNSYAVICIHGGAWTSDLNRDEKWQGSWMKHTASLLASLGFTAFEVTHRSITVASISEIISDIETAFKFIKEVISPRHGIKSIYVIGDSAGGHLAIMSAFFADSSLRPSKIVACNPVSDLTDPKWQLRSTTDEERKAASPVFFRGFTASKLLILHGDQDTTVPYSCSEALNDHLSSLGTLECIKGATHAFILFGYKTPPEQVNRHMEKAIRFFDSTENE